MAGAAVAGAWRRGLDALYDGAAALAGLFMVLLLAMVLLSIAGRQLHFNIPGIDAYAGYMMAGTSFLALAHTLKHNEHIRVTLLIGALEGRWKRGFEIWALFAASVLAALAAAYSVRLAWQSYTFHDVSTGNDATPLWLPQLSMAIGTTVLAIAFVDELALECRGRRIAAVTDGPAHHE